MNPLVPNWHTLEEWVVSINSMFGAVENLNVGYFDANIEMEPPFITDIPGNNRNSCFIFREVMVGRCKTSLECVIKLIEHIESYIDEDLTFPRDTSKATIVWRIPPEIKQDTSKEVWPGDVDTRGLWFGYARLKVLDCNSKEGSY